VEARRNEEKEEEEGKEEEGSGAADRAVALMVVLFFSVFSLSSTSAVPHVLSLFLCFAYVALLSVNNVLPSLQWLCSDASVLGGSQWRIHGGRRQFVVIFPLFSFIIPLVFFLLFLFLFSLSCFKDNFPINLFLSKKTCP
jgi:hypothetical protein